MLRKILNAIIAYQTKRAAYWQLRNLSDSQLRDMGLTRGEIYDIVYGPSEGIRNG